jgi:tRNA nucleotidyltransferase (CCA-adding enzyme)
MSESAGFQLLQRLQASLKPAALAALAACEAACSDAGLRLYLVGGPIRDLMLERDSVDLDLAIEGDVEPVARRIAAELGARLVLHPRFGTAAIAGHGFHLDLARTRRETYAHPGALPSVQPATLAEDLARRDFAINAMALQLSPDAGELVDPYRGEADLRGSLIRVLHDRSFQDDATRMLRAARYASRFGFKLQRDSEALLRRDLEYLRRISGPRLRRELTLLFEESHAPDGVRLLDRFGVLSAIHPALGLGQPLAERWRDALTGHREAPLDELGFCLTANPRDEGTVATVAQWLHLTGRIERALSDLVRLRRESAKLSQAARSPVAAVELLERYAPSAAWALSVLDSGDAGGACGQYLARWRHQRPHLSGDDLLELGVAPGVAVGEMLRQLKRARLQVEEMTRDEEIALVRASLPGRGL